MVMTPPLYPLRFTPIFQPRIWGGRRLGELFGWRLPDGPIGEAWVLSDRDDHPSRVADGPLQGMTIRDVIRTYPQQLLGRDAGRLDCFPLLLKFLDAQDVLSVQVHPSDRHCHLLPPGERGKTEGWLVLEAGPSCKIYAGLQPGTTADRLWALAHGQLADCLASFTPQPGDAVFLPAGTVHALGGGLVVFEVQQNSDVTYRLYDWDRIDPATGKPRTLHVPEALACADFDRGPILPIKPRVESTGQLLRERLFDCEHFRVWRLTSTEPFAISLPPCGGTSGDGSGRGVSDSCCIVVVLKGTGSLDFGIAGTIQINPGAVFLLPAGCGKGLCRPVSSLTILEIALAE
jgi:mannose-6-phosphate isomerase